MATTIKETGIPSDLQFRVVANADGTHTIVDVPIFLECSRGDHVFDSEWMAKAKAKADQAKADGYLPPLHIRHHGDETPVESAGVFEITDVRPASFKGETRPTMFADLTFTSETALDEVVARRLLYRSVEIFDVDNPSIDGLALLDHEAPYLELPMLVVDRRSVTHDTNRGHGMFRHERKGAANVYTFARGKSASFLSELFMADEDKTKDEEKKTEDMEAGGIDVGGVVKAIADGSIPIADFASIKEAIAAAESAAVETEEPKVETAAPPAASPPEAMSKVGSSDLAEMQAKYDALEAKFEAQAEEKAIESDVASATEKLKGRALGAKIGEKLAAFRRDHGAEAFKAYVDSLYSHTAPVSFAIGHPAGQAHSFEFVSDEANAYADKGPDAIEKAEKFAREFDDIVGAGLARDTSSDAKKRYIARKMKSESVEA